MKHLIVVQSGYPVKVERCWTANLLAYTYLLECV